MIRAVVDIVMMIVRNGRAGKPTPKYKGPPPKGGATGEAGGEGGVPAKPTATSTDASGATTAPQVDGTASPVVKQPSAKAQKKANVRAENAKAAAARSETRAQEAETNAQAREAQVKTAKQRADEQRARAEKNAATLTSKQSRRQSEGRSTSRGAAEGGCSRRH